MSFAIQPLRKICCTFTAAYVRGAGFILVGDLASEIQMYAFFTIAVMVFLCLANVTSPQMQQKLSALLIQLRHITNAGLTLMGSLCGIYDAGVKWVWCA